MGRRPTPTVRLAFARLVRFRLDGGRRRRCGLRLGQLRKQQRLVRIDRLGSPISLQEGIEPLLQLGDGAAIPPRPRQQFDNHLLQHVYVVREFAGINDGR
jgi:hypothetical protein